MLHLFLAPGFEDIEAVAPLDGLRRCRLDVQLVSIADTLLVALGKQLDRQIRPTVQSGTRDRGLW